MKILAIHSIFGEDEKKKAPVHMWRIQRPMSELKRHVDWQIDEQPTLIKGIEKYKSAQEFTQEEMQKAFETVCQYDIVFSSYNANAAAYTLLKVAAEKAGVQYVMDVDDDMFAINPDNPFWTMSNDENCYFMQCMIRDNTWITTTTERLAKVFRDRRPAHPKESVFVLPNRINDEYKRPSFDNGDKVVIGYFGGSSHYGDMHKTGVLDALRKVMHEHKNVHFKSVGMPVDTYLPKARYEYVEPRRGDGWTKHLFPSLDMDISLGPLEDNIFNYGKSNIKWQESTRAGACFVASELGPYADISSETAVLVPKNTSDQWYRALSRVVEDASYRKSVVRAAQKDLESNWKLESNWQAYKDMFLKVKEASSNK